MFASSWPLFKNSGNELNGKILKGSFTHEVLTNGNHTYIFATSACRSCELKGTSRHQRSAVNSSKLHICLYHPSFFRAKTGTAMAEPVVLWHRPCSKINITLSRILSSIASIILPQIVYSTTINLEHWVRANTIRGRVQILYKGECKYYTRASAITLSKAIWNTLPTQVNHMSLRRCSKQRVGSFLTRLYRRLKLRNERHHHHKRLLTPQQLARNCRMLH